MMLEVPARPSAVANVSTRNYLAALIYSASNFSTVWSTPRKPVSNERQTKQQWEGSSDWPGPGEAVTHLGSLVGRR